MTELQIAFQEWADLAPFRQIIGPKEIHRPGPLIHRNSHYLKGRTFIEPKHWDGACCAKSHTQHIVKGVGEKTRVVESSLPDSQVCDRERAWRKYISLRDRRDYHVPQLQ